MYLNWNDINNFSFRILTITGAWKLNSRNALKINTYRTYQIFVWIFLWVTFNIFQYIDLYSVRNDIKEISRNCRITVAITTDLLTSLALAWKLEYIYDLQTKFKLDGEKIINNKNHEKIYTGTVKEVKYLNKFFIITALLTAAGVAYSPLPDMKSGKKRLPFRQWTFFDLNTAWIYWLVYAIQMIVLLYVLFYAIALALVFSLLSVQIIAQYKVLRYKVNKINEIWYDEALVSQEAKEEYVLKLLKEILKDHQNILSRIKQYEDGFNIVLLARYTCHAVLLIVAGLNALIISLKGTYTEFLGQMAYITTLTTPIFILCLHGTRIDQESYSLVDAFYNVAWHEMNPFLRKHFILVLIQGQKPPPLTAGKLMKCNLSNYLEMIKMIYQGFAVFRPLVMKAMETET